MKNRNIKSTVLIALFSILSYTANAQNKALKVGTNPTIKETSASFEVEATDKGVLLPRVALTSTTDVATITTPAHALTVFNTATAGDVTPGYYYYSKDLVTPANSKWVKLAVAGSAWDLLGNAGTDPATNFLGTTDDKDLRIKVNNGNFGLLTTPTSTYGPGSVFFGDKAGDGLIGTENNDIVALGASAGGKMEKSSRLVLAGNSAGYGAKEFSSNIAIGSAAGAVVNKSEGSIFFGDNVGVNAEMIYASNIIGLNAGGFSSQIERSNFIGAEAGSSAKNASFSNFIGAQAGANTDGANHSIFIGENAGLNDAVVNYDPSSAITNGRSSILIGNNTNTGGFSNSIALGEEAVNTATNQFMIGGTAVYNKIDMVIPNYPATRTDVAVTTPTNFLYTDANGKFLSAPIAEASATAWNILGNAETDPATNFLGTTDAQDLKFRVNDTEVAWFTNNTASNSNSIFLGGAGVGATNAISSLFWGESAGSNATDARYSIFLGEEAGESATNVEESIFMGTSAGEEAENASFSNFIGRTAGSNALNASNSTFIGNGAGQNATNASNAVIIGNDAGSNDTVDNTTGTVQKSTILLGNQTSTGGFSNSIAIGAFATNTAENQLMIGDPVFDATRIDAGAKQYDMVNPKYPQTRDDVATTTPINFLYTDANGKFLSAPISAAGVEPWQVESTTNKATSNTDNIYQMGNIGIHTDEPNSALTVNGSANNLAAYDAGSGTTIDYSKSNLAYTTADTGNTFDLQNIKDGGTYTLAVQGSVSGTANFTSAGFTVHLPVDNGPSVVTGGKHSIYTILVLGTHVYMSWITGL